MEGGLTEMDSHWVCKDTTCLVSFLGDLGNHNAIDRLLRCPTYREQNSRYRNFLQRPSKSLRFQEHAYTSFTYIDLSRCQHEDVHGAYQRGSVAVIVRIPVIVGDDRAIGGRVLGLRRWYEASPSCGHGSEAERWQ